jgi:Alcohol dehydrogenase, class IV
VQHRDLIQHIRDLNVALHIQPRLRDHGIPESALGTLAGRHLKMAATS